MKIIKFLFCFLILVIAVSCSKYKNVNYHFSNLSLNHLDNTGSTQFVSYSDSINAKAYGIRLNLDPIIDSETDNSFSAEKSHIINTNTITTIFITSSDSFDVNLPPGACLNKRFIYYKNLYGAYDTIGCQSTLRPTQFFSKDYEQKWIPDFADILLINPPTKYKSHRFKIRLTFADGTVFNDSTSLIKLF